MSNNSPKYLWGRENKNWTPPEKADSSSVATDSVSTISSEFGTESEEENRRCIETEEHLNHLTTPKGLMDSKVALSELMRNCVNKSDAIQEEGDPWKGGHLSPGTPFVKEFDTDAMIQGGIGREYRQKLAETLTDEEVSPGEFDPNNEEHREYAEIASEEAALSMSRDHENMTGPFSVSAVTNRIKVSDLPEDKKEALVASTIQLGFDKEKIDRETKNPSERMNKTSLAYRRAEAEQRKILNG